MNQASLSDPILVFPSSVAAAMDFLRQAVSLGITVLGASSLRNDPNSKLFKQWFRLPMVNDQDFEIEFLHAISEHSIGRIFCPVNVVHKRITEILKTRSINVVLLPLPFDVEISLYEELSVRSSEVIQFINTITDNEYRLSPIQVSSILKFSDGIWGQCGEFKLAALMAAMLDSPRGDVVEIGTFLGKSISALVLLARWLDIGNVLAIDPWTSQDAIQQDASEFVQELSGGTYWEVVASQFVVNLAPIACGNFNFVQSTSASAFNQYTSGTVSSNAFGTTQFCGKISLLHIDGNHDYDAVRLDASLWLPLLVADGWVVFDDYCWPHGDGPRRVADQVLSEKAENIQTSFVCDGAMFIKFGPAKSRG